jgi:hypothetical protein
VGTEVLYLGVRHGCEIDHSPYPQAYDDDDDDNYYYFYSIFLCSEAPTN